MLEHYFDSTTKVSVVAGMLLGVFANIGSEDLVKTVILAAVGAVVSFVVSQVLKMVVRKMGNGQSAIDKSKEKGVRGMTNDE